MSKSPVLVQMVSRSRDGLSEVEIRKFFKKCKKQDIIREHLDKVSFFMTKTQKRREKRRKNAFQKKRK